ncbi:MAG: hypothetical protein AAF384_08230 [Pseudomonadota bacterium]
MEAFKNLLAMLCSAALCGSALGVFLYGFAYGVVLGDGRVMRVEDPLTYWVCMIFYAFIAGLAGWSAGESLKTHHAVMRGEDEDEGE